MRKSTPIPKPPDGLTRTARRWWSKLVDEYDLAGDEAGLLLLGEAMQALSRLETCREAINRDGAAQRDRFGQVRPHPLLAAERDARSGMLQALKAMHLDIEPLRDRPGRPGSAV